MNGITPYLSFDCVQRGGARTIYSREKKRPWSVFSLQKHDCFMYTGHQHVPPLQKNIVVALKR